LFVEQSNQFIERVSNRLEGLSIFSRTKNTLLPCFVAKPCMLIFKKNNYLLKNLPECKTLTKTPQKMKL